MWRTLLGGFLVSLSAIHASTLQPAGVSDDSPGLRSRRQLAMAINVKSDRVVEAAILEFLSNPQKSTVMFEALRELALSNDASENVRAMAIRAIPEACGESDEVRLRDLLCRFMTEETQPGLRTAAVDSISQDMPANTIVVRLLLAASNDPSADVRGAVYRALGRGKASSSEIVQALIVGLSDPSERVQTISLGFRSTYPVAADAAEALGKHGRDAHEALVPLLHTTDVPNAAVSLAACIACCNIAKGHVVGSPVARKLLHFVRVDSDPVLFSTTASRCCAALDALAGLEIPRKDPFFAVMVDHVKALFPLPKHARADDDLRRSLIHFMRHDEVIRKQLETEMNFLQEP